MDESQTCRRKDDRPGEPGRALVVGTARTHPFTYSHKDKCTAPLRTACHCADAVVSSSPPLSFLRCHLFPANTEHNNTIASATAPRTLPPPPPPTPAHPSDASLLLSQALPSCLSCRRCLTWGFPKTGRKAPTVRVALRHGSLFCCPVLDAPTALSTQGFSSKALLTCDIGRNSTRPEKEN